MDSIEHLLVCLTEECSEIIKATDKALRFGLDDGYPQSKTTNFQDIARELGDLKGVIELLSGEGIDFEKLINRLEIDKKKVKILKFMEYARERKRLK